MNCTNLTKINSIIPGYYNFQGVFKGCTNLAGNLAFYTNYVNNFNNAFDGCSTAKVKNLYTYTSNTVSGSTYNSILVAGLNGKNGVTVYNINQFTGI